MKGANTKYSATALPHRLNPIYHKPYIISFHLSKQPQFSSLSPPCSTMGICSSISVKNKKQTHTKSNSIMGGVKKVLFLGYSRRVRDRGKKSRLQSIKLEMEADVEAAVQGYGGMVSTPVQPLWQRKILMGERCEMPRYSGLILYDEQGFPLPGSSRAGPTNRETREAAKISLKDIL